MTALQILDLITCYVDCIVRANTSPVFDLPIGSTQITLDSRRLSKAHYKASESILVRDADKVEPNTIASITQDLLGFTTTLTLATPLQASYLASESTITKTHGNRIVENVVQGNPDHLAGYPSITVESLMVEQEPFTLIDWVETYPFDIGVWVDSSRYEDSYRCMIQLANLIKDSLTTSRIASELFMQTAEITRFDDAQDQDHLLKSATVHFTCKQLQGRRRNDVEQSHFDWWLNESSDAELAAYWQTLFNG